MRPANILWPAALLFLWQLAVWPGLASDLSLPSPESWALLPPAQYEEIGGHEVVSTVPAREPKGVIFILHGCLQLVTEWGFQSEHCPDCHGMPEEMVTVWKLWRRGYAAVAVGPLNGGGGFHCYATGTDEEEFDVPEVPEMVRTLRQILTDNRWWHLPRYAMGTSRGGAMALIIALHFPLQGVGSMVMGLKPVELLEGSLAPVDAQTGATWAFPPVLLMQAQADQPEVIGVIDRTIPVFTRQGIHVRKLIMQPYPITPAFFAERIRGVSLEVSVRLHARWRSVGLLDEHGSSNASNARALAGAREALFEELEPLGIPDLEEFEDAQGERGLHRVFIELLWAAEAVHEITSQHVDTLLDFFEDTTRHEPRHWLRSRWAEAWAGRGGSHDSASTSDVQDYAAESAAAPDSPQAERSRDAECVRQGPFAEYLKAELDPGAGVKRPSTAELMRGQNERQRVYNALLSVPCQLEQFLLFGLLICLDSFLAVFTVLPVRFARAALAVVRSAVGRAPGRRPRAGGLAADQLFDVLCVLIFGATFGVLRLLPAGAIYFWLKDLTQEFLKLHVVHSAVEIFDKIACAFVVDSLEALSGSCTMFVTGHGSRWAAGRLAMDAAVTLALVIAHGMVLLGQVMTFSVAMNSARGHALVALLIASNFVEIKGTIFKRFDAGKLFTLTCQDVAERFHLALALLFVVVEEMDNAGSGRPNGALLQRCGAIFAAEVAIDVTKHAVVTKFSDVRPGVYRTFLRDVCEKTRGSQSHTAHRVVAFEP
ncbi:hypothetical protein WJX81_006047 [Elliptochloris bilobata]|uniref:Uncharacterized protein n=1 Tax=Elliptochloris bilobata TaxID=381761 RepID=A0AAW1QI58_9CHLO